MLLMYIPSFSIQTPLAESLTASILERQRVPDKIEPCPQGNRVPLIITQMPSGRADIDSGIARGTAEPSLIGGWCTDCTGSRKGVG